MPYTDLAYLKSWNPNRNLEISCEILGFWNLVHFLGVFQTPQIIIQQYYIYTHIYIYIYIEREREREREREDALLTKRSPRNYIMQRPECIHACLINQYVRHVELHETTILHACDHVADSLIIGYILEVSYSIHTRNCSKGLLQHAQLYELPVLCCNRLKRLGRYGHTRPPSINRRLQLV